VLFEQYQPPEETLRKEELKIPEFSELDLVRHFNTLSRKSVGVDTLFYPLGSCTMKYNPKCADQAAANVDFLRTHPLSPKELVAGNLQILDELQKELLHITGMEGCTLAPNAGAQGEFVGIQMILAYHRARGETKRLEVLIPDHAHGTNPATVKMAGLIPITIASRADGDLDLEELQKHLSEKTAALMLTNPSTLGLFSPNILRITEMVHQAGGQLYYDGANMNPILEIARPGDMGFDVMHLNLHKTFATPHGGGGPGAGPVLCKAHLIPYIPSQIASFHGNFMVLLRAYLYIKLLGRAGLRRVAEKSVLNANYLKEQLDALFTVPYPQPCMHEFVLQADNYLEKGIRALDIAKRMLDYGIHAPTVYFPQDVKEALLIEPTECESKETLDYFVQVMRKIVEEIKTDPTVVKTAPHTLSVTRLDEVRAARNLKLTDS